MGGMRFLMSLAAVVVAAGLLASTPAGAFDPFLNARIDAAVERGDVDSAVAAIEAELAGETDPAIVEDLLARLATLLSGQGKPEAAGDAWRRLAKAMTRRTQDMAPELIPIWDKVALEYGKADAVDKAVEANARAIFIAESAQIGEGTQKFVDRLQVLLENATNDAAVDLGLDALDAHAALEQTLADKEAGRNRDIGDPAKGYKEVKIYYATDRARSGSELPVEFYGGDRGELELGTAVVSIPDSHRPGAIETPSVWTLDFRPDPQRHMVLASVTPRTGDAVFAEMQAQMSMTERREAFIFVHGFNVPFNEAAMRTAQMAYDMNFDGLPILYSWPSRASVLSYIADSAVVNLSGRRLGRFLEDVVAKSGATRIHLIAHSMGNRALTDALELFALRHQGEPPAFDQVLFTAPDLDAGLFAEMLTTIRQAAHRVTLYASNRDWALAVSRQLHGDAPRAGQGGDTILHLAEVDSIDMTSIGEDMLAHSYYANNPSALTDILSLFWRDAPPEQRCGMTAAKGEHGAYWSYSPEVCGDSAALLSTLSILRRGGVATIGEARSFMNRYILAPTIDPGERSRLEEALRRLFVAG